jgi:DNA-binding MarR family transcriptional regulator
MTAVSTDSETRSVLRSVAAYEGNVTAAEVARLTGMSRQLVAGTAAGLARQGLLSVRRGAQAAYTVTDAGRAELARHKTTILSVEADDRLAPEVSVLLQSVNGVEMVYEHGNGCCCPHCPHRGNCR